MEDENHLPMYGIGPIVIGALAIMTVIAVMLSVLGYISKFEINPLISTSLGIILIVLGAAFWMKAVFNSDIQSNIKKNSLVTTGVYGLVRHPIYAAFLYALTGILLIANNMFLMVLPLMYWAILTAVMIKTEEAWLIEEYGDDYIDYSRKVNRFIPKVI
jgi:protein-S-isoprenylcysteine O-methyltransferase Ste14